jgi:hypothetical protein
LNWRQQGDIKMPWIFKGVRKSDLQWIGYCIFSRWMTSWGARWK